MFIFLGLSGQRGGSGVTLFKYNKTTEAITKVGPLFPAGSKFNSYTGEGFYFSASSADKTVCLRRTEDAALRHRDQTI